jgi:hypothetical protein
LKDTAAEINKLGIDRPRLAAQVSVGTEPGAPFEVSGVAQLNTPYQLSVTGTAADRKGAAGLNLTIRAARATGRPDRQGASLRSQVVVPLGRPVVLGATPAGALASAFVVQVVRQEPPGRPAKPDQPAKPGQPARARAFRLEFRAQPWTDVLKWLSNETGTPANATRIPTGKFTFVGPEKKAYTLPEVIDIINDGLLSNSTEKYYLIHGPHSFTVVPADERIDPSLVPRVPPADLERRGRTELVAVVIPLQVLMAEDLAPDIQKMLGPFGQVVLLKSANQLMVMDTAANVRRVYQVIQEIDRQKSK